MFKRVFFINMFKCAFLLIILSRQPGLPRLMWKCEATSRPGSRCTAHPADHLPSGCSITGYVGKAGKGKAGWQTGPVSRCIELSPFTDSKGQRAGDEDRRNAQVPIAYAPNFALSTVGNWKIPIEQQRVGDRAESCWIQLFVGLRVGWNTNRLPQQSRSAQKGCWN